MSTENNEDKAGKSVTRLEGRYSNYFHIGQNAVEFILEFGQLYPEDESSSMHTRIVTSPVYAKAFLETLQGAVQRYEATNGPIPGWFLGDESRTAPKSH